MATLNLGRLKPVFRGSWNSATAYNVDDIVVRNNQSYISIQAGTNQDPATATAYWTLMAAKGSDGTDVGATLANKEIAFKTNAGAVDGIPIGNAGEFLKVNSGATGYEYGSVSSDFVKLATFQQLTSVQEVSIDGFYTSDYDTYYLEVINVGESSDNKVKVYMNESGSKVTSNNMRWLLNYADMTLSNNSASDSYTNSNSDNNIRIGWNKSDMNGGTSTIIIQNPLSTTLKKYIRIHSYSMTSSYAYQIVGGAEYNSTNALSGVTIGGNSTSNTIKFHRATLYGLKH